MEHKQIYLFECSMCDAFPDVNLCLIKSNTLMSISQLIDASLNHILDAIWLLISFLLSLNYRLFREIHLSILSGSANNKKYLKNK